MDSSPNEIGDTLAGFSGTLAFIWIIVTVWLQSNELEAQRSVLVEQKEEFKLMVAAQNEQVRALQAQARIFETEKETRDQLEAAYYVDELVEELKMCLSHANTNDEFEFEWKLIADNGQALQKNFKTSPLHGMGSETGQYMILRASSALEGFFQMVCDETGTNQILTRSDQRQLYDNLLTKVVAIDFEARQASAAKRKSLENLGINRLVQNLGRLLDFKNKDGFSLFEER